LLKAINTRKRRHQHQQRRKVSFIEREVLLRFLLSSEKEVRIRRMANPKQRGTSSYFMRMYH